MNNINDLHTAKTLLNYLRAGPARCELTPPGGWGSPLKKKTKSKCYPPKNLFMPPSTPQFSRLSIILAKNILAAPIAPSLPLGFPFSAHNLPPPPLSRKLISPPKISPSHQPRHEAFSEAVAKAKRSAKRLLAAIRKNGANDYEIPFLSQTLVTNTLALGAFFAP